MKKLFSSCRKALVQSLGNQILPLLRPPHLLNFFACCFLHFGTFAIAGGMALFFPDVINKLSMASHEEAGKLKLCDVLQMDAANVTDSVCQLAKF